MQQKLQPTALPVFTSDGLNLYFYALTAHFGSWLQERGSCKSVWQVAPQMMYAQVQKMVRRRKLVMVKHVMRLGTLEDLRDKLQSLGFSGKINTAFVERVNLTIRRSIAGLARQTWATAQTAEHLLAQAEVWRSYYHFVRVNEGLRVPIARQQEQRYYYRQRTPAQAAGLTQQRWSMAELLRLPLLSALS